MTEESQLHNAIPTAVANATVEHARENMRHFLADLDIERVAILEWSDLSYDKCYRDGRFAFVLLADNNRWVDIQMPGWELSRVRFTGSEDQNIWHFPRLYVDGGGWVWSYALSSARVRLYPEEES